MGPVRCLILESTARVRPRPRSESTKLMASRFRIAHYPSHVRKILQFLRKSRALQEVKAFHFTFLPLPIALVDRRLVLGHKIHDRQAKKWSAVGHYDWRAYVEVDDFSDSLVRELDGLAEPDDSILDICCNVGRNLNSLADRGYHKLLGVDIMQEAISKAPELFPALHSARLSVGNAVDYLQALPPLSVDWAITQSATIELIHPSFRLHRELKRVVRKGLVLVIDERGHSYPRYWRYLLKRSGFKEIHRKALSNRLSLLSYSVKVR
jgi:SAM-dependent methyltransferase